MIFIPLFILFSCSEIEDYIPQSNNHNNTHENYVSPFMGSWGGTYSGEVSGTLIFNVSKSGSMEVIRTLNGKVEEVYYTSVQEPGGNIIRQPSQKGFTLYGCKRSPGPGPFKIGAGIGMLINNSPFTS